MDQELTLLSKGQIVGDENEERLEVFDKYGSCAQFTDLFILTGGTFTISRYPTRSDPPEFTADYWTKSTRKKLPVAFSYGHDWQTVYPLDRFYGIRPVLKFSSILSQVLPRVKGENNVEEVKYGEYPQNAVDKSVQEELEKQYKIGMIKTGRSYTLNSRLDNPLKLITYEEYRHLGKNYIRVQACMTGNSKIVFSNGQAYKNGDYVWVEVSPVKWLIDDKTKLLISEKALLSGVVFFCKDSYDGDFNNTVMFKYLNTYMLRELIPAGVLNKYEDGENSLKKRNNPYGFKTKQVSEEEIMKGAIESGVAVFLHGPSSEGKSARVKQIDPTCEIIYLRNATPESLNGKSVYNQETGEMIDIKPSWLKKLEEKCEKEPDRYHILFLDELTNALPSIQGIAFNIVLDKEVNGIWKLPDNARIVAAGNDMNDSLAANQLAEPLFNRFAHVYIKTTVESWLKWASENNIHPAIYSYIAYKKGETLRSKYDGEKPNADPRKWEMASKMLYATENPEVLRALIGEDITREFVEFCNQPVITLEDVINGNYTSQDIEVLNSAERYATVMGLSRVDDDNLEKVREFAAKLGEEFVAFFDSMWTHGEESRLERIAEAKLAEAQEGGMAR